MSRLFKTTVAGAVLLFILGFLLSRGSGLSNQHASAQSIDGDTCGTITNCSVGAGTPTPSAVRTGLRLQHRFGVGQSNLKKVVPDLDSGNTISLILDSIYWSANDSACPCDDQTEQLAFDIQRNGTNSWVAKNCVWTLVDGTVATGTGTNNCQYPSGSPSALLSPPSVSTFENCNGTGTAALVQVDMLRAPTVACSTTEDDASPTTATFFPMRAAWIGTGTGDGTTLFSNCSTDNDNVTVRSGRRLGNPFPQKAPFECPLSANSSNYPLMTIRYRKK